MVGAASFIMNEPNVRLKVLVVMLAFSASAGAGTLPKPDRGGVPESKLYDYGVMGPPATPAIVAGANEALRTALPAGPYQATWDSIRANYRPPG